MSGIYNSLESLGVLHLSLNKRHFDDLHVGQIPLGSCRHRLHRPSGGPPTAQTNHPLLPFPKKYFLQLGGTNTGWLVNGGIFLECRNLSKI